MKRTSRTDPHASALLARARALGLWSIVTHAEDYLEAPWLPLLLEQEEKVRSQRSLERRKKRARLRTFKPMSEFDWEWAPELHRKQVEDLFTLHFMAQNTNVLLIGGVGVGKTMIAKNLAHQAILSGYSARFITAHTLLNELADCTSGSGLLKKIRSYARLDLLVIDELGYLDASIENADLFFQLINERYEEKPTVITSNKPFEQWQKLFAGAACACALIDRIGHHAEVIHINAPSFRGHEATERKKKQHISTSKKEKETKS